MGSNRLESIDVFRGLAILGMVLANFLGGVEWVPASLKHARDTGFTIIDLVAPMFIFAIALTYGRSFKTRMQRDGAGRTYQHFVTRFCAILGMGALFGAGQVLLGVDGMTINWGVLQAIGTAGLVTLCFIRTPTWVRLLVGALLLCAYQYLLDVFWLTTVLSSPHGGLLGAISWSGMLIMATVLADLFHHSANGLRRLIGVSALLVPLALLLSIWLPISKNRVSLSYDLLSLGLSGLIFSACHILIGQFHLRARLLVLWGRNPLLLYLLHLLLLGFLVLPGIPALYAEAPLGLVIAEAAALLGILTWVAWRLDRRGVYFSV